MTSYLRIMLARFFAKHNLNDMLPLSNHDDILAGDSLTVLTLNRDWRMFIMATVERYMNNATGNAPNSELDTLEKQFLAMFIDFYD